MTYKEFISILPTYQDLKYQEFTKKLVTTKYPIIGIRIPTLRRLAKKLDPADFLSNTKSSTFEEVFTEGLLIASITDQKEFERYITNFLPKIDNWSICDSFCQSIKIIKTNPDYYFTYFQNLAKSQSEYTSRTGLVTLLKHYINEEYIDSILKTVDTIHTDKYYVNMAIAWLLCEIYILNPTTLETYLSTSTQNNFTINKTISKIKESYRVTPSQKEKLSKYKRKERQ